MTQIITNTNGGGGSGGGGGEGDMKKSVYDPNNIQADAFDYNNFENTPDLSGYQTTGNLVTNLSNADNTHYPSAKAVADAISSSGGGDMLKSVYDPDNVNANAFDYNNFTNTPDLSDYVDGPASSTDGDVVLFDGATGKVIKDSGVGLSSKLDATALSNNAYGGAWNGDTTHTPTKDALYDKIHTMDVEIGNKAADTSVVKLTGNQTINGTKTFGTSPVVPSKTTAATNTGTAIATEAQVKLVADDVATINGKIPSAATSSNQLADKDYVNDGINSVTAYYITKNANGDQFATYAELSAATTFYSGGVQRTPTRNDYCIVQADENHDNATTRYIYNASWEYQYTVNETALTTAQLNALNSGITSGKVSTYDGYASTISGKQDTLVSGTNIKTVNNQSLLGSGNISINGILSGAIIPSASATYAGRIRFDTVNNKFWKCDGTEWTEVTPILSVNGSTGAVTVDEFTPGGTATTGYVVTKTAGGYEWQAPTGGIQLAPNTELNVKYHRYGSQASYDSLNQYYTDTANDTAYFTI